MRISVREKERDMLRKIIVRVGNKDKVKVKK